MILYIHKVDDILSREVFGSQFVNIITGFGSVQQCWN